MTEAPKVYCKKEDKDVPIWYCIGSFFQGRRPCPHNAGATVYYGKSAETVCRYPEEVEGHQSFIMGVQE